MTDVDFDIHRQESAGTRHHRGAPNLPERLKGHEISAKKQHCEPPHQPETAYILFPYWCHTLRA